MRELKWHIINDDDYPLCWDNNDWESDRAIEFESKEEAKEFLEMILLNYPDFRINGAHIVELILYYDGGYVSGAEAKRMMMEELNLG